MEKSIEIRDWFCKAHLYCLLAFRRAGNRILRLILLNLVFHNYGAILNNVTCLNVTISNCSFINCKMAVGVGQLPSTVCRKSSLVITDTEFLYSRNYSVYVYLFNELFLITISRCVFKGKVGRFKATSEDRLSEGDVYIKSETFRNRIHVHGIISDSTFRDLAHGYNGFALSFNIKDIYSTGKVVKNSFFLGGNETLGTGDAIRFQVKTADGHSPLPTVLKAAVLLVNVTFQGLHDSAIYVSYQ